MASSAGAESVARRGDTGCVPMCKVTPVISHGDVSHGFVSPEDYGSGCSKGTQS